jgi:magnesium chelatase subunit I
MSDGSQSTRVLPYASVVGQEQLKRALELSYIEPRISGVLISGERGSGKSTTVRSFAQLVTKKLPVTLPINATEDRVVGGWDVGELVKSKPRWKTGLLEKADGKMLYVDEVNLLDDHIVNIILDVTSSGLLTVERDSQTRTNKKVQFTLVGTMNPEEGTLRPQLLDRFGLMVDVRGLTDAAERRRVLATVLGAKTKKDSKADAAKLDKETLKKLKAARKAAPAVVVSDAILDGCVALSKHFGADGHRGEVTLALAAGALAALRKVNEVTAEHLAEVASLALQHRRKAGGQREWSPWTEADTAAVNDVLKIGKN